MGHLPFTGVPTGHVKGGVETGGIQLCLTTDDLSRPRQEPGTGEPMGLQREGYCNVSPLLARVDYLQRPGEPQKFCERTGNPRYRKSRRRQVTRAMPTFTKVVQIRGQDSGLLESPYGRHASDGQYINGMHRSGLCLENRQLIGGAEHMYK